MKRWIIPVLILWVVVATVAALLPQSHAPEPIEPTESPQQSNPPPTRSQREHRRLRKWVERLQAAVAASLAATEESAVDKAAPVAGTPKARSPGERLLALMDEAIRLEGSDEWTTSASWALQRKIYALLASDPSTHVALMERLREVPDEDAAWEVLSLLVENPFARTVTDRDVVDSIQQSAREMLADPLPHRRAAALRVLYGYRDATRDDVLLGIDRLASEPDAGVREEILAELSIAGRGHGLTDEQARPLLDRLRARSGAADGGWAAGALARWSTSQSDFDRIADSLVRETNPTRAQELLNAFDRDTRLAGAHVDASRRILLNVLEDPARDANVRSLAHSFLLDYAPWDETTADAARRYLDSIR